jgi:hypothetical protein
MADETGRHRVRWGAGTTSHWDRGTQLQTVEDVYAFLPLAQGDFADIPVVGSRDYRDEERLNHVPWNVPPEAIKRYLELSAELAWR